MVSAYHVIFGAKNLSALTLDKKRYPVEVVGYDDRADLALLHVNLPASLPSLPLATVRPTVGELTLTIGNGNGEFLQAKTGRVTTLETTSGRPDFPASVMQLDTQILPGDGGGPIITARGEVVGVVSFLAVSGGQSRRVTAYAVPLMQNDARLAELRRGVKRDAPSSGVDLKLLPPLATEAYALPAEKFVEFSQRSKLDLGTTPGAFFTQVAPGSPAARAGLQPLQFDRKGKRTAGDIVTAVNGQRVVNFSDFLSAVYRYQPGEVITLTVLRAGRPLEVKLTLVARAQAGN
ncbi:serine protease (plasmid) [Deinococcus aetherius]|uniref:Serine protease n=1 Tax=Deinococcus aetherius TaxID=200252 RepID=A0ABN6RN83_9DEIO|nr:S1C family serine protease [Deinococcus aetherius]BDP43319.1 serine protease [Deinococcus aetherius]